MMFFEELYFIFFCFVIYTSNLKDFIMRKCVFLLFALGIALFYFSNDVNAQNKKSIGLTAGLGFLEEIDYAKVGIEFNLDLNDHFRFSPSANYYFSSSSSNVSLDGDLNYLIKSSEKLEFFPIVGISYIVGDINKFGLNLGFGMQYDLANDFAINAKAKYQLVKNWDDILIGIGLVKNF